MITCKICNSQSLLLYKKNNIPATDTNGLFTITDANYGVTGELYRCATCGFIQCTDIDNPEEFYKKLEDIGYESSRETRSLQARKLLKLIKPTVSDGRLLDIGAGSGIFVEEAIAAGYDAIGIEPSEWLQVQASARNIPIVNGLFPHEAINGKFAVITLIDVLEHVSNPGALLQNIANQLEKNGVLLLVTPDVGGVVPRLLGHKWWHFRVAHIGYFNRKNLLISLDGAGLVVSKIGRPWWFFGLGYLLERVCSYLPPLLRFKSNEFLNKVTIPLNLGDSLYVIAQKR